MTSEVGVREGRRRVGEEEEEEADVVRFGGRMVSRWGGAEWECKVLEREGVVAIIWMK